MPRSALEKEQVADKAFLDDLYGEP